MVAKTVLGLVVCAASRIGTVTVGPTKSSLKRKQDDELESPDAKKQK